MRLGDLTSVQSWLPNHPTAADSFWQREALAVSEGEIQLFYARADLAGVRQEAIDAIDALQSAVILASFKGELAEPPTAIVLHEPPPEPFLTDELVDGLIKLRPARRQACLLALETHSVPKDVTNLTWAAAREWHQLSGLSLEILAVAGRTRHFKLPYVFWEHATTTIATPLLELQWSIERAFDYSWPELVQRYRRMVKVNRGADAASLLDLANQH